MSRFNKALLASASFAILASAAHAQTVGTVTPLTPLLPPLPPGGVFQTIDASPWPGPNNLLGLGFAVADLVLHPGGINVTNLAGAVGPNGATSEAFQISSNTLNQFGSAGSAIFVIGDYSVTQQYAYAARDNVNVVNSNGAFSSGGFSTTKGSQVIATAINNTAVDNGKGGQDFTIAQTYAPSTATYSNAPFGGTTTVTGVQHIDQQNSMTAGYDTNKPDVGTGGSAIIGTKLPGTTGTSTTGLQANTFSINTASVNLVPPLLGPYTSEDLKLYQSAVVNAEINLFNVADAGVQNPSAPPPPKPHTPPVDPSISNLQQIAAVTINSATLTGDPQKGLFGDTPASFDLEAAFKPAPVQNNPFALAQTPNQYFAGFGGNRLTNFVYPGADITLFNVAHALTWSNNSYGGPGTEWAPGKGGAGDVSIGGPVDKYGNGGVKQIVAVTINSVSGATSQDGKPGDQVNVNAGTYQPNLGSTTTPPGTSAFWQYADLTRLTLTGRPDNSKDGGAGIRNSFVNTVDNSLFPSYTGSAPIPVPPSAFDWDESQNTAIAGTGVGNATLQNVDQIAALTVNSFSFDNSVTDKTTGKITSKNTDEVSGRIAQDALLGQSTFTLSNVAEALTGKGVATLDTVTQTNVFSVNSFTAGTADFTAQRAGGFDPLDPLAPIALVAPQTNGLTQTLDTRGLVLNLGNLEVASGSVATVKDTKQINAVSLNTGTIGTTLGGGILQTTTGGLTVNAGNYLQATGSLTASITNASQITVVGVNSISGYAH